MLRRILIFLSVFACTAVALASAYWGSAVYSVSQLEAALRERDVVKLQKYVDWPEVREHLRASIHAQTMGLLDTSPKAADATVNALAGIVVGSLLSVWDSRLDASVSPEAVVTYLNSRGKFQDIAIERTGFTDLDEYAVSIVVGTDPKQRARQILPRARAIFSGAA